MTEPKRPVLIGDHDANRANWLSQFLSDRYNVTALMAPTFEEVRKMAREPNVSVIFLADTIPFSSDDPTMTPYNNFIQLQAVNQKARLVCVVTGDEYPVLSSGRGASINFICLPSASRMPGMRNQIIRALRPLSDVLPLSKLSIEELDNLTSLRGKERTLNELIRSLSHHQDWKDGKRQLFHLIRNCLDGREVERIEVEPLTQGKSGAIVFRLGVTPKFEAGVKKDSDNKTKNYVLKLSKAQDIWKLESEVKGYLQASKSELYSSYKAHVPSLQTPRVSKASSQPGTFSEEFKYIASSLSWDAIYYDFLGGHLGECMALDTALISAPEKIQRRTAKNVRPKFSLPSATPSDLRAFRLTFMETLLDTLCEIWYLNKPFTSRKVMTLWKAGNARDERKYVPLPPYRLAARSKGWVEEFLDSEAAVIGRRMFAEWDDCQSRVLNLVRCNARAKSLGLLGEKIPVTLSPVHGDLNAGNAFLWLKQDRFPFLIDLPFYQRQGHVLQDFARLEVEVKFTLMDRQEESPPELLTAFDHGPANVPLWRELEDHLLSGASSGTGEPAWLSAGFRDNVSLTYHLVKLIRDRAELAQQQPCPSGALPPVAFMQEYLPSLLYHTVRAITYPSLTLFKRLLAVYSSGRILKKLGF
jgi:hypothetical protein